MEITLSMKEQEKLAIIIQYADGKISCSDAAKQLGLSVRQVQRKKKAYLAEGMSSIIHKSKGKTSGRGYSETLKKRILTLYREEYTGWNFCHFGDVLEDEYGIFVSNSFLYRLLTYNGIKSPKRKKHKPKPHPPRPRRENAGELLQVDASKHQWLYGTDKYFYLHGAIDDATGIVTACILMEQETCLGYQLLMRDTIKNYGIPECLYTDYRTVFQSSKANKELTLEEYLTGKKVKDTRFAAMWYSLGSDIASTEDPRAKGRIERLWQTFQDRLVKELHKQKISTIAEANRYINGVFLPKYNTRFASSINQKYNYFIPVPSDFDYNRKLALWVNRKVLNASYISIDNTYYAIQKGGKNVRILTPERLRVLQYLDGSLHLEYEDWLYELKVVPKAIVRPQKAAQKIVKKARPTGDELSKLNRRNSQNSPWRQWNPEWL